MSENNASEPDNSVDRDQQLEAVIADYIRDCEIGTTSTGRAPFRADSVLKTIEQVIHFEGLVISDRSVETRLRNSIEEKKRNVSLCLLSGS